MDPILRIPDIEYEAALLLYIRTKADIRLFLSSAGNDMCRFSRMMSKIVKSGFAERLDTGLTLTESGALHLKHLNRKLGRRGLYTMILPDYSVKISQNRISDLYIPEFIWKKGDDAY